jgi:hypothetical protein
MLQLQLPVRQEARLQPLQGLRLKQRQIAPLKRQRQPLKRLPRPKLRHGKAFEAELDMLPSLPLHK